MSRFEPEWYDALKGEPLNARMFTPDLAAGIRAKALRSESARRRSRTWRIGGLGAAGLAAVIVLAVAIAQEAGGWRTMGAKVEPAPSVRSSGLDSPPGADSPPGFADLGPPLKEQLHTASVANSTIQFSTETWEYKGTFGIRMILDFYEQDADGSPIRTGGTSHSLAWDEDGPDMRAMTLSFGMNLTALVYYGMLYDPDIVAVRAVERKGEASYAATIVQSSGYGHRYLWLVIPDDTNNAYRYQLEGLNEKGEVIARDADFNFR